MKPNIEQEKFIEQLLRNILKFKDTYDEVYDHILSSLDTLPDDVHFTDALYDIITYEFGGPKGLKTIERKHTLFAIRHFIADYLKALLKPFTSVAILFLIAGTGLFYFSIVSGWLDKRYVQPVLTFIPLLILGVAVFKFRKQVKALQARQQVIIGYVRQNIIAFSGSFMLFLPFFLWNTIIMLCHKLKDGQVPSPVYAIVFFVVALHTFAAYKIYTMPVILNIT